MAILLICIWCFFGFATFLAVVARDTGSITIGDILWSISLSPFGFVATFTFGIPALMGWADTKIIWGRK